MAGNEATGGMAATAAVREARVVGAAATRMARTGNELEARAVVEGIANIED